MIGIASCQLGPKGKTMYKTLSAPLVVQIEATYRCPCKCRHCYNFLRSPAEARSLPTLSFWQMDRISAHLIKHKVFHAVVTGGEPLANKNVVFDGIEKPRSAGITVGVNSNLIPLRNDDARLLKQLGVSSVLTSLLGPDENSHQAITLAPGSFKRTIRGIRLLQEAEVPVFVNMVVSQANKHLLSQTAEFAKSLGIKVFYSTRAACPGNCFDFSGLALSQFFNQLEAQLVPNKLFLNEAFRHSEQSPTGSKFPIFS